MYTIVYCLTSNVFYLLLWLSSGYDEYFAGGEEIYKNLLFFKKTHLSLFFISKSPFMFVQCSSPENKKVYDL